MFYVLENIEALTSDFPKPIDDDTPDQRSRAHETTTFAREFERACHELAVCLGPDGFDFGQS
jgi:hypothetical protein